ncbi:uncharacterized protein [Anolis sagrei]|uniref:uncharacterized protein n=1 Tax=Anolis sagrei TaxID=38937 RepID=UPI00352003FB
MKLLVVLFGLTVVTGGRALTIREDPPSEPKLEELTSKIYGFWTEALRDITEKFDTIRSYEPVGTVKEQQEKTLETLWQQMERLPPEMREAMEKVSTLSWAALGKAFWAYFEWNWRYYNELRVITEALALYVDPVASKAFWCVEWLEQNVRPTAIKIYQEFERPFDHVIESLMSTLSPYTKELEEIGESLQAPLNEVAKQLRLGVETLNADLKPYWVPFLTEYKKYDPALMEWITGPLFPPPKEDSYHVARAPPYSEAEMNQTTTQVYQTI